MNNSFKYYDVGGVTWISFADITKHCNNTCIGRWDGMGLTMPMGDLPDLPKPCRYR
jgi:hypothetical protein